MTRCLGTLIFPSFTFHAGGYLMSGFQLEHQCHEGRGQLAQHLELKESMCPKRLTVELRCSSSPRFDGNI